MGAPFTLTVLSEDGYQVFAALHRQFDTWERAVEGAKEDYRARYGGNPTFRVYRAERDGSSWDHTLIEVCFDETKRRSFVALYKVLRENEPIAAPRPGRWPSPMVHARRLFRWLRSFGRMLPRPPVAMHAPGFG